MSKVHVNMPNHFYFYVSLLVVYWRPADNAIHLLHKEVPVPTFHEGVSTVVKALSGCLLGLLLKNYLELLSTVFEVLELVKGKFLFKIIRKLVHVRKFKPVSSNLRFLIICLGDDLKSLFDNSKHFKIPFGYFKNLFSLLFLLLVSSALFLHKQVL